MRRSPRETTVVLALTPKLEGLSGNLVVNADERGALVEVDGRPRAFTPDIVNLPAGQSSRARRRSKGIAPSNRPSRSSPTTRPSSISS